jgi:hypothetical protein
MSQNMFNKLADEVILEILNHLYDELYVSHEQIPLNALNTSLYALVQTNKQLHRVALPLLYRHITISTAKHLHGILHLVTKFPYHAALVKRLWLAQPSHTPILTQSDEELITTSSAERMEEDEEDTALGNINELSNEAAKYPLPHDLLAGLREGHLWAQSLFLLYLLPKLEELQLGFSVAECDSMLAHMIHHGLLSPKLRMVGRSVDQGTVEADVLVPFFLHPSVTKVQGHRVVSSEMELQCERLLPHGCTLSSFYGKLNVERIELHSSRLDGDAVTELLLLPRALKTFIYSEAGVEHERTKLYFEEALESTSATLENLSVRWRETGGFIAEDYTWTLHYFKSLRNLYISYRLMFGPQPAHAVITSDVFPPTLQVLGMFPSQHNEKDEELEDEWEDADYIKCFEILLLTKDSTNLPGLRLIAHLDNLRLLETLADLAESRGVEVAFEDTALESLPI